MRHIGGVNIAGNDVLVQDDLTVVDLLRVARLGDGGEGNIPCLTSLFPDVNGTRGLGSSGKRWANVWGNIADFATSVSTGVLEATTGQIDLLTAAGSAVSIDKNLLPSVTGTQTLGSASYTWANVYCDSLIMQDGGYASLTAGTLLSVAPTGSDSELQLYSNTSSYRGLKVVWDGANNKARLNTRWGGSDYKQFYTELNVQGMYVFGHLSPANDNQNPLGSAAYRYSEIFCANATINTSQRSQKKDIVPLDVAANRSFIRGLTPVNYRFVSGTSGRLHAGLVAEDVLDLITGLGLTPLDVAAYCQDDVPERVDDSGNTLPAETRTGLRYGELIAPLIRAVQELYTRVEALEAA
jgi:hypothetical protein